MTPETLMAALLNWVVDNPEQAVTVLAAAVGVAFNYAKTGKIPIGRLPYRVLRETLRQYGDKYFGTGRPRTVPGIVVDATQDQIDAALRRRHFESGDLTSYEYEDEVLNLRRPRGWMADPDTGRDVPMETHVRTFDLDDGRVLLLTHDEANRYEATSAHLSPGLYSWTRGRDIVSADLDDASLPYDFVDSERDAGLVVEPN
jgi:hypothetical protein